MSATETRPPQLSVVIPVYRNLAQLPELLSRLAATLGGVAGGYEIVFVEDAGKDGSLEWLLARARQDPRVGVIGLEANMGQHAAMGEGLRAARGKVVVVMDADLQNPPEEIPRLLQALGEGKGAVFGARPRGSGAMTGRIFKRLLGLLTGGRLPVGAGTFVAMSRGAAAAVVLRLDDRPHLPLLLATTGLPLQIVEVSRPQRPGGGSGYTGRSRTRLGSVVLLRALQWRFRPLLRRRDVDGMGLIWRMAILVIPTALCVGLALTQPYNSAPDEYDHIHAVRFFEEHWLPPDLDSDEVWYSAYGWSRVYTREWSYWALGRAAAALGTVVGGPVDYRLIRLFNVAALPALLVPLLFFPSRRFRLDLCAVFIAAIPQVIYVCSYVNGDAWSMAVAGVLVRVALHVWESPAAGRSLLFGALLGLTVGTKRNALVAVPLALGLAGIGWRRASAGNLRVVLAALLLAVAVAAPLRLVYPLSQAGHWREGVEQMRAKRARPDLSPLSPGRPTFHMRKQGVPMSRVLLDGEWWQATAVSSYAKFGYMTVRPPKPVLVVAAVFWLVLVAVNLASLRASGVALDSRWAVLLGCAVTVGAMLLASNLHSWTHDYQPQGRYLFPALVPLSILVCGVDSSDYRLRAGVLAALCLVGWLIVALVP